MQLLENKIVKTLLGREAFQQFQQGNIAKWHLEKYANLIKLLSESYVSSDKEEILKNMSVADLAVAYALYYLPINFYKLLNIFSEIGLENVSTLRVIDYGAGPATGTLAALRICKNLEATVFDKSEQMLHVAERLLKGSSENITITSRVKDFASKNFDLIIVANALNEFSVEDEDNFIKHLDHLLAPNGIVLILEPALQNVARNLCRFREKILAVYNYDILYPCTHCLPCPMLNESENWCHASLDGLDSRLVSQLDDITSYNKHRVKYSSLVLQKREQRNSEDQYRIVDLPKKDKRGITLKLCGTSFYGTKLFKKDAVTLDGEKIKKQKFFDKVRL